MKKELNKIIKNVELLFKIKKTNTEDRRQLAQAQKIAQAALSSKRDDLVQNALSLFWNIRLRLEGLGDLDDIDYIEKEIYTTKKLLGVTYKPNDFYLHWEHKVTHSDEAYFDNKMEEDVCRLIGMGLTYNEVAGEIRKKFRKRPGFNKDQVCRIVKKYCDRFGVPRKYKFKEKKDV